MRQTQTKHFSWEDVGLDFSVASSNIMLDRFKRMFADGYNEKTVESVTVSGNQVVLTYGVAHNYVVDRILKINSGDLATINGGEFAIDSVTSTTVTLTIDNAPSSVAGGFTTKVAPLGWQLVYELDRVQVYKFKALDESDLYLRIYLPPTTNSQVTAFPCVGKSYDPATGFITDPYANTLNKDILAVNTAAAYLKWAFATNASTGYINYTYAQGYSAGYGRAMTVGSKYHLALLSTMSTTSNFGYGQINAIVPTQFIDYPQLKLPVVFGNASTGSTSTSELRMMSGDINLTLMYAVGATSNRYSTAATQSFLPATIDSFNTTTAVPFYFKEQTTFQQVGFSLGGAFHCSYASSNQPSRYSKETPWESADIDLNHKVIIHYYGNSDALYVAFPIEEIKYGV